MNSKLSLALSEFSKGRWAAEPSDEPPLHPTELNLVTRLRWWLGKLSPLAFARYLIIFHWCGGHLGVGSRTARRRKKK